MRILLIAYDNEAHATYFPLGLGYLASVCRKAGHEVIIYNQDVYHFSDDFLTTYLDKNNFDVVGLGAVAGYYTYKKILNLCSAINNSKNRPILVLGGHLVSPEPEFFLRKSRADYIVIGEGEVTLIELLESLEKKENSRKVNGIAFFENGIFVQTEKRLPIDDIDTIPFPAWDLFPMDHYTLARYPKVKRHERSMTVLTARGCQFKCNFCYRIENGIRLRSDESIIEELKLLNKNYHIPFFYFADELLMSSEERTIKFCKSLMKSNLKINWICSGRLNYAKTDVLKIMKEAGCVFIYYGIEAFDDQVLRNMNKSLSIKQIIAGIENTQACGISPGFNMLFGNIGDNRKTLEKATDFLLKYDDHAELRAIKPVQPYPGSPLYYYAINNGLLKGCEDFYENKNLNTDLFSINFTDLSDEEFNIALFDANEKILKNYFLRKTQDNIDMLKRLYFKHDISFRGFRHT